MAVLKNLFRSLVRFTSIIWDLRWNDPIRGVNRTGRIFLNSHYHIHIDLHCNIYDLFLRYRTLIYCINNYRWILWFHYEIQSHKNGLYIKVSQCHKLIFMEPNSQNNLTLDWPTLPCYTRMYRLLSILSTFIFLYFSWID